MVMTACGTGLVTEEGFDASYGGDGGGDGGYGCGSGFTEALVPDRLFGIDLLPACTAHDQCYATGTTTPRSDCDAALGEAVQQACADAGYPALVCAIIGFTYEAGVRVFGAGAYNPQPLPGYIGVPEAIY